MRRTPIRTALGLALVAVLALLGLPGIASAAVPAAPVLNADVNANKSVDLVWTPIAGATSYRMCEELYTPANGVGDCLGTTTDTTSRRGPLADGTYRYFVTAINADGESGPSNKVTVTVPQPAGLPTVTITTPQNGDTVSGMVTLDATTDEPDEDVIEYLIDGQMVADDAVGDNTDGYLESWDSTTVANGRHYFQVRATDLDGESLTTAPDAITVDNDVAIPEPALPAGTLTAPAPNSTVSGVVALEADAVGADVVEFLVNSVVVATDNDATNGWQATWDSTTVPDGYVTIEARATNEAGSAPGDVISVLVDNDPTSGPNDPPPAYGEAPPVPASGPVPANDETEAFASGTGDLADDPAIYVDPTDPTRSVIIGSKKATSGGGLGVYDLNGDELSFFAGGELNNVDLRTVGDQVVVLTTERGSNTLKFFTYDPVTRTLADAGSIPTGFEPYGGCLYQSDTALYGFVTNRNSPFDFDEYALTVGASGVTGSKVRDLSTSSLSESCVAFDAGGEVYLSQEDSGVYRYSASPGGGIGRATIATVGSDGVTADVEGLAIAYGRGPGSPGYLIVSSQGASTYQVFDLGTAAFVKAFTVTASADGTVDEATGTDGLEVTRADLGPAYPDGLLVVHDTSNSGASVSNFKMVDAGLVLGSYATQPTDPPTDPDPPAGTRGPGGSVTVWEDDFESGLDCGIWQRMQNNDTGPNGSWSSSLCTDLPSTGTPRGSFPADSGDEGVGDHAFRSEVRQGDLAASGERSELSGDGASWSFHEGDDMWLQQRLMVEPTLTQEQNGRFYILDQWHAGSGSPPFSLQIADDGSLWIINGGVGTVPDTQVLTAAEFQQGTWYDISIHFVMSINASVGGVEVFVDGVRETTWRAGQTMADSGSYLKIGQYRDPQPDTGVVFYDDVVLSRD